MTHVAKAVLKTGFRGWFSMEIFVEVKMGNGAASRILRDLPKMRWLATKDCLTSA